MIYIYNYIPPSLNYVQHLSDCYMLCMLFLYLYVLKLIIQSIDLGITTRGDLR